MISRRTDKETDMGNIDNFKKKIAEGKLAKGVFVYFGDSIVSEMTGMAGYDFVWIDAEHGPLDRQEILYHIIAAKSSGCCSFIRIPIADPAYMKAILDMGPDGLIFPFTNNRAAAELAVNGCRYPRDGGVRGQGPQRAINYGLTGEMDYIESSRDRVFKIMQIETVEGYENLDDIMDVDGVDSIFIGAADLSRSIEAYNMKGGKQYDLDQVYDDICKRVKARGIPLGVACGTDREDVKVLKEKGVNWIACNNDIRCLATSLRAAIEPIMDI